MLELERERARKIMVRFQEKRWFALPNLPKPKNTKLWGLFNLRWHLLGTRQRSVGSQFFSGRSSKENSLLVSTHVNRSKYIVRFNQHISFQIFHFFDESGLWKKVFNFSGPNQAKKKVVRGKKLVDFLLLALRFFFGKGFALDNRSCGNYFFFHSKFAPGEQSERKKSSLQLNTEKCVPLFAASAIPFFATGSP